MANRYLCPLCTRFVGRRWFRCDRRGVVHNDSILRHLDDCAANLNGYSAELITDY